MKIGTVELKNPVIAAPMAGVTDKAFRILAREAGCGLVFTEMTSAKGLVYANKETSHMVDLRGEEKPIGVQLFGTEPHFLAEGAKIVESLGADIIDLNMGCPAPKIVKSGEGCALMKNLDLAEEIIRAVVKAVKVPVTVKMRKGWDENQVNALALAQRAERAGAAAVTVHGRTREQFYAGVADWDIIRQVKAGINIPVIGNGDIWEPEDARRMMEETGCDGVMIGRGAMGNPFLFRRVVAYLTTGASLPPPTLEERVAMALRHLDLLVKFKGETIGVREMRKHGAWYLKGIRDGARLREKIQRATTRAEMAQLLHEALKGSVT